MGAPPSFSPRGRPRRASKLLPICKVAQANRTCSSHVKHFAARVNCPAKLVVCCSKNRVPPETFVTFKAKSRTRLWQVLAFWHSGFLSHNPSFSSKPKLQATDASRIQEPLPSRCDDSKRQEVYSHTSGSRPRLSGLGNEHARSMSAKREMIHPNGPGSMVHAA